MKVFHLQKKSVDLRNRVNLHQKSCRQEYNLRYIVYKNAEQVVMLELMLKNWIEKPIPDRKKSINMYIYCTNAKRRDKSQPSISTSGVLGFEGLSVCRTL